jgi:hypothetical protein
LPNKADQELLDFLEEEAIIQGYDHEGFQYLMRNNSHLHQMNDDRNNWQEGLKTKTGNTPNEDAQIQDFS